MYTPPWVTVGPVGPGSVAGSLSEEMDADAEEIIQHKSKWGKSNSLREMAVAVRAGEVTEGGAPDVRNFRSTRRALGRRVLTLLDVIYLPGVGRWGSHLFLLSRRLWGVGEYLVLDECSVWWRSLAKFWLHKEPENILEKISCEL